MNEHLLVEVCRLCDPNEIDIDMIEHDIRSEKDTRGSDYMKLSNINDNEEMGEFTVDMDLTGDNSSRPLKKWLAVAACIALIIGTFIAAKAVINKSNNGLNNSVQAAATQDEESSQIIDDSSNSTEDTQNVDNTSSDSEDLAKNEDNTSNNEEGLTDNQSKLLLNNNENLVKLNIYSYQGEEDFFKLKAISSDVADRNNAYIDGKCNLSENTLINIFADNFVDDSGFGSLSNYKEEEYQKQYKTVSLEIGGGNSCEYEIFAVFIQSVVEDESVNDKFKFFNYPDLTTEEEFNTYVNGAKELSSYDTGILPVYGDRLLAMITPDYTTRLTDGRLVVIAREIK